MEFHQQLIHQHHLQSHLHCGNDPTVANHNGILSTTNARNTGDTPFTMRNRSENDPPMIRAWSDHTRDRLATVAPQRYIIEVRNGLCMEKHRLSCICYLSKTHFVRDFLQNSIGNSSTSTTCNPIYSEGTILELQITMEFHISNSSTSTTCNPIYNAGTILQLQITMEFCRPHMHEKQVTPHLQCGTDPRMIRPWSEHDPTTHETVSQPSHRRGRSSRFGDGLCMEKHRLSCICYLSKTHFVRDFLQNSIGNSSTSTTCNPIYSEGTILELQIGIPSATHPPAPLATPFTLRERSYSCKSQWNSVDRTCTKNRWHPIYNAEPIREWSAHDPSMIRPHTRPSRNRRTAEVDHRGSGTDFVWKNIGFRASAISQKRISCETSFKTPSATPPPAPLAIPFTLREQFLWLTRSLTNSFFANSFFALSLTHSFFANSFFDYLIYPD